VLVLPADISDREGAKRLLEGVNADLPRLSVIWADQAYNGPELASWVKNRMGADLVITNSMSAGYWLKDGEQPPDPLEGVEPHRWVVERTFAWQGRNRRLARDYEYLPETEEALCYLAAVHLMLKRLTK
jgi:transposase